MFIVMKKELVLFLTLALLIFANEAYPQNETISEDGNETIATEGNETVVTEENKTEGLKSPLVDCSTKCKDANGCVCPQDCEKKETNQGFDCGKKTPTKPITPPVKEVSLCPNGCLVDNECLEIGTQRQESTGTALLYCSANKKMETAKDIGENCDNDYECLAYNCQDQTCIERLEEEKTNYKLVIIIGIIILVIGLVFLTFKRFYSKKNVKEETKPKKEESFEKKIELPEYKYQYRPEFDVLEKKLKESLGKTKK